MAMRTVPTPFIIPLRPPMLGKYKSDVDSSTPIEITSGHPNEKIEIYYTLNGCQPEPHKGSGINWRCTNRYKKPFNLPEGKVVIKAVAQVKNPDVGYIVSSVVTRTFNVEPSFNSSSAKVDSTKEVRQRGQRLRNMTYPSSKTLTKSRITKDNGQKQTSNILQEKCISNSIISEQEKVPHDMRDSDESIDTYSISPAGNLTKRHKLGTDSHKAESVIKDKNGLIKKQSKINVQNSSVCCQALLQTCMKCHEANFFSSRFCKKCGNKLSQICKKCLEQNPANANFCCKCGHKVDKSTIHKDMYKDFSGSEKCEEDSVVKPKEKTLNKVQIKEFPSSGNKSAKASNNSTIEKGYWRKQLDHIIRHIKAHAHSNLTFRTLLGDPPLGRLLSADVVDTGNDVIIRVTFAAASRSSSASNRRYSRSASQRRASLSQN